MKLDVTQVPDRIVHDTQFFKENSTVFRVVNLALPLLVMVPRARFAATLGLGAYQIYFLSRECKGKKELLRIAYVASTLGLQIFRPEIARVVQTLVDLAVNIKNFIEIPERGKGSVRVMRSMVEVLALRWGTSTLFMVSMAMQIALDLLESQDEFRKGNILEGVAHILYAAIRAHQTAPHVKRAKRDWFGRELTQEGLNQILEKKQAHQGRFAFNKALEEGNYKSTLKSLNFNPQIDRPFDLSEMDFWDVNFEQCRFAEVGLTRSFFHHVTFKECYFESAMLNGSHFSDVQFTDSTLRGTYLHSCQLDRVTFDTCDLFESSFFLTKVRESKLLNCRLTDCLLLDTEKDFKIVGGTPHQITRPVVGMSWDFKNQGFGVMSDTISYALAKENVITLHVESVSNEIDPFRLEKEVHEYLPQVKQGMSIPLQLLKGSVPGSETDKLRQRSKTLFDHIDAFVLPGGLDIEPELYGAPRFPETHTNNDLRRSMQELAFIESAKASGKQVLGICRGAQMINVFHGGTLHQHVDGHRGVWQVMENRSPNAMSRELVKQEIEGLSLHHQAIKDLGEGLEVVLKVEGVPKLVISEKLIASQFHPEAYLWIEEGENRERNRNIFVYLVQQAKKSLELRS